MIVDDAPFIREVLRHLFEKSDVEIVGEAKDGAEAVALVKKTKPEVVLMDLVMPNKSGIEATAEILKELPETRVIACSTLSQNGMVMRALEVGCCNFVSKPFKSEEVLKAVRAAAQKGSKEAGT